MITFDPAGPLPSGTTVLEASAGTGKTYAIAALAARYLAEGQVTAAELTVISFSRIASGELRTRVRQRLRRSIEQLTAHQAGTHQGELDPTDTHLANAPAELVAERIMRLRRAAASLDEASIMTIHQFCQAMLAELGVLAEQDLQADLVEDFTGLLEEVVCDLYLSRYAKLEIEPPFPLAVARQLARDAVERADARLVPTGLGGYRGERISFADAVRVEFARRKLRQGIFSFDDQLQRLLSALSGPSAAAGLDRLRRRCRVVLVDEFQDTDPVQWQILRAAFHGEVPLILIGDPKQSIYAFRGADVTTYTAAVTQADQRYSLDQNWRADAAVVKAVGALFHNALLGEEIEVPQVHATHLASRLIAPGTPWQAPMQLRCLGSADPIRAQEARAAIIADLTKEVVSLLTGTARLIDESERELRASDIAILVSTNQRGRQVSDALVAAGVPVAFSGADSIFATPAATDWLTLLRALDEPRRNAIRSAVLTDFVGADLTDLATASDDRLTAWAALLQTWMRILNSHGIAALFAAVQAGNDDTDGLAERLLARAGGERDLTDFRHLAELLHAQHVQGVRGPALVSWLAAEIASATASSDRIRRLETDRSAVQVMTVHKAKGLQFPVVLLPEAADLWVPDDDSDRALTFHLDGERVLDLGGTGAPGRADRFQRYCTEEAADRLRALYVAATRAQSHLTLWWAPTMATTAASPLHRLLFRRRDQVATPELAYPLDTPPGDSRPDQLAWLDPAGILVTDFGPVTAPRLPRATATPPRLRLAGFDRQIDTSWRRTSYSGLTEAVHAHAPVGPSSPLLADEPSEAAPTVDTAAAAAARSPMADLPGGTGFGSLVHHILENLDWYAPTPDSVEALPGRLLKTATEASSQFGVSQLDPADLATAMLPSLLTPLGRLTGGLPLAAIPVSDRLSELNFEFALGSAASIPTLSQVADLLARWLPKDDPLGNYPAELAHPLLGDQVLHGFLTGSIDSVFRIPGPEGPRFVVVDYKTNRLGPAELTLAHYEREPMVAEMIRTHYPLQAMLYCVALHRFLTERLVGYEPERHLGGVGYLFVRGMGGPEARPDSGGTITGVFDWYPPAGLVVELSDLLAGRRV